MPRSWRGGRSGAALVLALIVTALLSIIVIEFVYSTSIDLRQAKGYRDDAQVAYAVDAALLRAETLLRHDKTRGRDLRFDSLQDVWNQVEIPGAVGDVNANVKIVDEASKLNLVNLMHGSSSWRDQWKAAFVRLCQEIRNGGDGNEDYGEIADLLRDYMENEKPFELEDQEEVWRGPPILSIDELAEIEEIEPEFFYGDPDPDDPGVARIPGMWEYLTIYSHGRVNINTAQTPIIQCLSDAITDDLAAEIVSRRDQTDEETGRKEIYRGKSQLQEVEGMDEAADPQAEDSPTIFDEIHPLLTCQTQYFLVNIDVNLGEDVTRYFRAYYKRQGTQVMRLLLEEVPASRIPLPPQGVDLEEFDHLGF